VLPALSVPIPNKVQFSFSNNASPPVEPPIVLLLSSGNLVAPYKKLWHSLLKDALG
jgi:hypothetical protein